MPAVVLDPQKQKNYDWQAVCARKTRKQPAHAIFPCNTLATCSTDKNQSIDFHANLTRYYSTFLDILPGMNAGDSYGAQARHGAAPELLRRVPAAVGIAAPLTSQANRACPALRTLIAPTTSAFSSKPHPTHSNLACVRRFSADTCPQHGQVRLVYCGGTATSQPPFHASL